MQEENSVSVKVFLAEGNKNIEVRRFEIDQAVVTNYDYVRERLQIAIPKLKGQYFKLLWRDADGDEVTISSDEELMIALSEIKTDVCKFIVRIPTSEPSTDDIHFIQMPNICNSFSFFTNLAKSCPIFAELQADVNCNNCQQAVSGYRYKCLECPSYFNCNECEKKNVHPDHVMLRLQKFSSFGSMISKGLDILRNHAAHCDFGVFSHEKTSHSHSEKEKCGGHHRRRFRRHGHHGSENKHSGHEEQNNKNQCPAHFPNYIGSAVDAFIGIYKDMMEKQMQPETEGESVQKDNNTVHFAEPPSPISARSSARDESEENKMEEDVVPSTSANNSEQFAKIKMALELLAEMGFNDENNWLTRLLEHFDGDIAKTLDHLMLGK